MALLVHFEDQDYTLDLDEIDVAQARHIKRQTGMSLLAFQEALQEVDPDALVAAYWLMMAQNSKAVDMNRVNFKIVKFAAALDDAGKREAAENPTAEGPDEAPPVTS